MKFTLTHTLAVLTATFVVVLAPIHSTTAALTVQ